MEEEEPIGPWRSFSSSTPARRVHERGVLGHGRPVGVGEVTQQREMQMRIAIGQEPHFQVVAGGHDAAPPNR